MPHSDAAGQLGPRQRCLQIGTLLAGRGPMLRMAETSPQPCLVYSNSHKIEKQEGTREQINLVSFVSCVHILHIAVYFYTL
jgi:hypothetical protein